MGTLSLRFVRLGDDRRRKYAGVLVERTSSQRYRAPERGTRGDESPVVPRTPMDRVGSWPIWYRLGLLCNRGRARHHRGVQVRLVMRVAGPRDRIRVVLRLVRLDE